MKQRSMIGRLMFSVTAAVVSFWITAAVCGIWVMREEFAEIFDSALQETAERLTPLIVDDLGRRDKLGGVKPPTEAFEQNEGQYLTYQARDAEGRVLLNSSDIVSGVFPAPVSEGFWEDQTARYYTVSAVNGTLFVQVADQMRNRREAINEGALALLLPIFVLVPFSLYIIRLVAKRSVAPVSELSFAIGQRDTDDLNPIEVNGLVSELQPIVKSVNFLMERVRTTLEAERSFTANSAHELRTPIAGALAQTQRLKSEVDDPAARVRVEHVEVSLQKLTRLVEKLMQLARAEANITHSDIDVDLLKVLDFIVLDFKKAHQSDQIVYVKEPDAKLVRPINADAFAIVMRNLIENALLHGDKAEPVAIKVTEAGNIIVINSCKTLSAIDIESIQKRFSRASTNSAGSGLGLPIALDISKQMRAKLTLSSPALGRDNGFSAQLNFS